VSACTAKANGPDLPACVTSLDRSVSDQGRAVRALTTWGRGHPCQARATPAIVSSN
jgi:hypothetical protein